MNYATAVEELYSLAFRLLNQIPTLCVVLDYGVSHRATAFATRTNCCQIVLGHRKWLKVGSEEEVLQQAILPAIAFATDCARAIFNVKAEAHVKHEQLEFRTGKESGRLQLWRGDQCLAVTPEGKEMIDSVAQLYLYYTAAKTMQ